MNELPHGHSVEVATRHEPDADLSAPDGTAILPNHDLVDLRALVRRAVPLRGAQHAM